MVTNCIISVLVSYRVWTESATLKKWVNIIWSSKPFSGIGWINAVFEFVILLSLYNLQHPNQQLIIRIDNDWILAISLCFDAYYYYYYSVALKKGVKQNTSYDAQIIKQLNWFAHEHENSKNSCKWEFNILTGMNKFFWLIDTWSYCYIITSIHVIA